MEKNCCNSRRCVHIELTCHNCGGNNPGERYGHGAYTFHEREGGVASVSCLVCGYGGSGKEKIYAAEKICNVCEHTENADVELSCIKPRLQNYPRKGKKCDKYFTCYGISFNSYQFYLQKRN